MATMKAFAILNSDGTIATEATTHLRLYTTEDNNGAASPAAPEAVPVLVEITY